MSRAINRHFEQETQENLVQRLKQNPEYDWIDNDETAMALFEEVWNEAGPVSWELERHVAGMGCQVGVLRRILDDVKQRAAATGKTLRLTKRFVAKLSPLTDTIAASCDCLLQRGIETYGRGFWGELNSQNLDRRSHLMQLLRSSECPNPFDGFSAAIRKQ